VSGYICYGCLPLLYSNIGLTNDEYQKKKREKLRKLSLSEPYVDEKMKLTPAFHGKENTGELDSLRIDEEDKEYERYSK